MARSSADDERYAFLRTLPTRDYNGAKAALVAAGRCAETTGMSWSSYTQWCARPVKDEGLCGIHLAAKRRTKANADKQRQKYDEDERLSHALSRIFDFDIYVGDFYGHRRYSLAGNISQLLADMGVEPPTDLDFDHQHGCPHEPIGHTHIGETCREYMARTGLAPVHHDDNDDLEEE